MGKRKVTFHVDCKITIDGKLTEAQANQIEEQLRNKLQNDKDPFLEELSPPQSGANYEMTFWGDDIEIEIDSDIPINLNCVIDNPDKFALIKLREAQELVESGNAAVDEKGHIVDAREHPERPRIESH